MPACRGGRGDACCQHARRSGMEQVAGLPPLGCSAANAEQTGSRNAEPGAHLRAGLGGAALLLALSIALLLRQGGSQAGQASCWCSAAAFQGPSAGQGAAGPARLRQPAVHSAAGSGSVPAAGSGRVPAAQAAGGRQAAPRLLEDLGGVAVRLGEELLCRGRKHGRGGACKSLLPEAKPGGVAESAAAAAAQHARRKAAQGGAPSQHRHCTGHSPPWRTSRG